jgi:hypothetical protein
MRFNNLLEAAQPQTPSVAVFLDVLTRISNLERTMSFGSVDLLDNSFDGASSLASLPSRSRSLSPSELKVEVGPPLEAINVDQAWDHVNNPLTQPSERSGTTNAGVKFEVEFDGEQATLSQELDMHREAYKDAAFAAPASPAGAPETQDLSDLGNPFTPALMDARPAKRCKREPKPKPNPKPKPQPKPRASVPKPPPKRTKWEVCGACDSDVVQTSPCVARRGIGCDRCGVVYHLDCVGKVMPPKYGSYICVGCKKAGEH